MATFKKGSIKIPADYDVELSVAALKLAVYRKEKNLSDREIATLLTGLQKEVEIKPRQNRGNKIPIQPMEPVTIGDHLISLLITVNPYGIGGEGRNKAPSRVIKTALKLCSKEEDLVSGETSFFLGGMERMASSVKDDPKKRLTDFVDHYGAIFHNLAKIPERDWLSIDLLTMMVQYGNYIGHMLELAPDLEVPPELSNYVAISSNLAEQLRMKVGHGSSLLQRVFRLRALCNELAQMAELARSDYAKRQEFSALIAHGNFFQELDEFLEICEWRYDEARLGLIFAALEASPLPGESSKPDEEAARRVVKYGRLVLSTIGKLMRKIYGGDHYPLDHAVFGLGQPVLEGYEKLSTVPELADYMVSVHPEVLESFIKEQKKKRRDLRQKERERKRL